MIELNEQELEQVAGGTFQYGSHSASDGGSTAYIGIAKSSTYSTSTVTYYGYSSSSAGTRSAAAGYDVTAGGASSSGAGASY